MPTSVHLPQALLDEVDRKARALQISRNQLVVRALEREVRGSADWSPDFFERLLTPEPGVAEAVDDLLKAVRGARRSKSPRQF
jgi:Ribbon-helix-helix protein, copG family